MIAKTKLRLLNLIKNKNGHISLGSQAYLIWNKIKISGYNNKLTVLGNGKFRRCTISIKGNNNLIEIAEGSNISFSNLEIVGDNCCIKIGKKTDIGGAYLSSKGESTSLIIGNNCMLSRDISIMTYDGHPIYDIETQVELNKPQSIHIGNNVWIAANASILKGVLINDGSIVGFGSIVTKDVDKDSIVVGTPAIKIKSNIYWNH